MGKTTVKNSSGVLVEIKEGNAGVYSKVGDVEDGGFLRLDVNEHTTYREYWCAVQPRGNVILTSDDCTEHEEVEIYMNEKGQLAWKSNKQRKSEGRTNDENLVKLYRWFLGFFSKVHS